MKPKILIIISTLLTFHTAFPPIKSYATTKPQIEIIEVNIKNKINDSILFKVNTVPTTNTVIQIDSKKIIIKQNELKNTEEIKIIFKQNDSLRKTIKNTLQINSKIKGLAGTTEQIFVSQNNKVIDIVCWEKDPIAKAELKDIKKIKNSNIWKGKCIDSKKIKTNMPIKKELNHIDANSNKNWIVKTTKKKSKKNTTSYSLKNFKSLSITEVFPNPKGKDDNQEWIELYNSSNNNIKLDNLIIQLSKKKITLKNEIIKAKSYKLIRNSKYKFSLKNTNETITLVASSINQKPPISYKKSKEGKSFSLIKQNKIENNINNKNINTITTWQWTQPTPQKQNTIDLIIKGEITEINQSTLKIKNNQILIPDKINSPLLHAILRKNKKVKIIANKSITHNKQSIVLKNYSPLSDFNSIKKKTKHTNSWITPFIQISIFLLIITTYLYYQIE